MKKYIFILLFLLPFVAHAQPFVDDFFEPEIFKAKIVEVVHEEDKSLEGGLSIVQQNLLLEGIEGAWNNKEFNINTINDIEAINSYQFEVGDKVIVSYDIDFDGNNSFYIIDSVRHGALLYIFLLFIIAVLLVGRWKGLRSLLSLLFSFLIIFYFIIPNIFNGSNPVWIALLGGLFISPFIIYFTEGWNNKSHASLISIYISLLITGLLSWFFIKFSSLSGVSEELMFLVGNSSVVDFKGLLLAGIIIGSLGVLDDLVISQVSVVKEIIGLDNSLSKKEIYTKAKRVGVSHLGSMTNTLFLAYAGVSLPLLLLFYIQQPPLMTIGEVLNSELIATEIIRTLVGSIGLVLAMPISTILAIKFFKK
ncbi:YibE/F family protein [Patescibacteria group bacterium]|nr:YibE/F family protein [Patescibacteria group bacterium]